jgi:diacylglycerol kinase family enzyme
MKLTRADLQTKYDALLGLKDQSEARLIALIKRVGTDDIIKQREDEVKMLTEQNLRLESETTKWGKAL